MNEAHAVLAALVGSAASLAIVASTLSSLLSLTPEASQPASRLAL